MVVESIQENRLYLVCETSDLSNFPHFDLAEYWCPLIRYTERLVGICLESLSGPVRPSDLHVYAAKVVT